MNRSVAALIAASCLIMWGGGVRPSTAAQETTSTEAKPKKGWPDPKRFEARIAAYEAETTAPKGAIVAYGSSSMGGWHRTIADDLKPFAVVKRGFGGSNMNDALHYMDRVVVPLKPKAVLLYEGDNDVAGGLPVDEIMSKYESFFKRLHEALPGVRTYVISVKPSISRWSMWPTMQEVNARLKRISETDPLVTYIDVATPMLNADGKPREEIFLNDKLHMNRAGYEIWKAAVLPVLQKGEGAPEAK